MTDPAKITAREHIAKAIQMADKEPCPEGYATQAGYTDHDWLSDWSAFLSDRVKDALDKAGYAIVPKYRCDACAQAFDSAEAKAAHRKAKHEPAYRKLPAKDRPKNRGDVPCGLCGATFRNEHNAMHHRRNKHGVMPNGQA